MQDPKFERNDNVSHHILRLAYCGSLENRNWFLTYECALFKYRAELRAGDDIATFMSDYGMHFTPVPDDERRDIDQQLRQVAEGIASKEDGKSAHQSFHPHIC
jgi:DNA primase large subunit